MRGCARSWLEYTPTSSRSPVSFACPSPAKSRLAGRLKDDGRILGRAPEGPIVLRCGRLHFTGLCTRFAGSWRG